MKPCDMRKFGRNWEEVVEGRQGCMILWEQIRLPLFAPRNGNRTEKATGREISAQFNEELPVKRQLV